MYTIFGNSNVDLCKDVGKIDTLFIVHSRNYGAEIYPNTNKKLLHPLKITQNKILKILQFKKRKSETNALYEEFKVLEVEDLHMCNTCCLIQKNNPPSTNSTSSNK